MDAINRCKAEIRLDGKKIGYFELLKSLMNDMHYGDMTKNQVKTICNKFDVNTITEIVNNIDNELPDGNEEHKLTCDRKNFVIKLLTLRHERLYKVFNEIIVRV